MNIEINNNMNVNTDGQNINLDYDNDSSQMSIEDGKPSITIPQTTMTVESGVGSISTGGTTDHAKLQNLDYENSGHTGFQKAGDYVEDSNYTHTDNNFTDEEKNKLAGIEDKANYYVLPSNVVKDSEYIHTDNNYTDSEKSKLATVENNANNYVLPSDVVKDNDYTHTDNNYTDTDKTKLSGIEANANNFVLPSDVVQDSEYVHTNNNFTDEDKEKLDNLENFSGKAQDVSYEDNYGYGGENVQDALDSAFARIDEGFGADAIGYKDNLGYDVHDVQDALDKAFDTLDGKMDYKDFTEQVGNISDLRTEDTSNVVNAINNVNSRLTQLPTTVPVIPQTKISQLVMDGVKYLKIEWTNNPSFLRYQGLNQAFLHLYKYTKTGRKKWVRDEQEIIHSGVKKWVHPANIFATKTNHQCWGIRSFDANTVFAENYSVDDIINDAEYPIANDGYVKTEYPLEVGQTSVLIPLNDIVSPILKVASIGTEEVVLPCEGDGLEVKLMGVKQNKNKGRCNQPIKFCLVVGSNTGGYVGSCLNVATIQLFKYRVTQDNARHGYDTRYSVLPDVGYSVYIK